MFEFGRLKHILAMPRFHHRHHGIEPEAVDVNFAATCPWLDRLFGTYHLPDRWPGGYGAGGHPVPSRYPRRLAYPFRRD